MLHSLTLASWLADSRYRGGPDGPGIGSQLREYTGPLCPISLRVEEVSEVRSAESADEAVIDEEVKDEETGASGEP